MLSPVRPEPESPNNRYFTCPPSEREQWTRDDRFKVVESSSVPSLGDRKKCPSERRAPRVLGKLSFARRICKLGLQYASYDSCSDLVNSKARNSQGRLASCTKSEAYVFK